VRAILAAPREQHGGGARARERLVTVETFRLSEQETLPHQGAGGL
jgi:hypothetical protein